MPPAGGLRGDAILQPGKGGRRIRRGGHAPAFEGNVLILFALRFSLESPKLG